MDSNGRPWSIFLLNAHFWFQTSRPLWTYLSYYMLFKSYTRVQYAEIFFFWSRSRSIGYKNIRYIFLSVRCLYNSFRFVSFRGSVCFCVCVSLFLCILLLSNVSMLMIRIILWEKKESKAEALNLIQSAWFSVSWCSLVV